ncbi:N-acetylornithine carbamoyltransferase [Striga asiatica]|uniref:N-acetylornithine carbamoyltransferase n=1 Tax=Striga asiatica TaxID=4170 RepID=A0A5A7P4M6_STRAF|nr:N-acetylornithine carbamoyltransferase [Striga asiatica]
MALARVSPSLAIFIYFLENDARAIYFLLPMPFNSSYSLSRFKSNIPKPLWSRRRSVPIPVPRHSIMMLTANNSIIELLALLALDAFHIFPLGFPTYGPHILEARFLSLGWGHVWILQPGIDIHIIAVFLYSLPQVLPHIFERSIQEIIMWIGSYMALVRPRVPPTASHIDISRKDEVSHFVLATALSLYIPLPVQCFSSPVLSGWNPNDSPGVPLLMQEAKHDPFDAEASRSEAAAPSPFAYNYMHLLQLPSPRRISAGFPSLGDFFGLLSIYFKEGPIDNYLGHLQ